MQLQNSTLQYSNRNLKVIAHYEVYTIKRRPIGQAFAGGNVVGGGKPGYSSHDAVAVDRQLIGYALQPEEVFINNDLLMVWKGLEGDDAFTHIYHRLDKYEEYQVEIVPVELKDEL